LWEKETVGLQLAALEKRKAGDYRAAQLLYEDGYAKAVATRDTLAEVRFLISIGGCQLGQFAFRPALSTFLKARDLAQAIDSHVELGAIHGNLSSLYLQMWDFQAAQESAEQGLALLNNARIADAERNRTRNSYFASYLYVQLGRLKSLQGQTSARDFFLQGIDAARALGDTAIEARAWDLVGDAAMAAGDLTQAEQALGEAFRLRLFSVRGDLGFSYGRLAALRLLQGDYPAAATFTNKAVDLLHKGSAGWPDYLLKHQLAQIQLANGNSQEALADYSEALAEAADWQLSILPTRSTLTGTNIGLEERLFRSFTNAAANYALEHQDSTWAAKAFEAAEGNRAAALRESVALREAWSRKLPQEYWKTLAELNAQEALRLRNAANPEAVGRLHLKLTEMEAQSGLVFSWSEPEKSRNRSSLIRLQKGLRESEMLASFALNPSQSYLWAVTRDSIHLYRLPGEERLAGEIATFRQAILARSPETRRLGRELYGEIFGQLSATESQHPDWLLSLDGSLFGLPFAALTDPRNEYLIEGHTLQMVPGALYLNGAQDVPRSRTLVAVGDPIYNVADPRWMPGPGNWTGAGWITVPVVATTHLRPAPEQTEGSELLERLVGSGQEVDASAATWRKGGNAATVLKGALAARQTALDAMKQRPSVIHLATHVVTPGGVTPGGVTPEVITARAAAASNTAGQALIAFGLTGGIGAPDHTVVPEYLSSTDVARLNVPGALVVMTGCATGQGDVRKGAGLQGLTSAWLMAGATAVIATHWPVDDSTGDLFTRFYQHLTVTSAASPVGAAASEALRKSQVEMIHSGTWRSEPAYWASYQLTGGSH
jgi:CHAT domain-containing protein